MNNLRYAFRQLCKSPGFTAVALITLGLGIGANTAIFSLVNALLFRPLPFRDPQQLVWIVNSLPGASGLSGSTTRVRNFVEWQKRNQSFEELAAYFAFFDYGSYTLTGDGEAVKLQGMGVTETFLKTMGVQPQLGRGFAPEECQDITPKAVMLTDGFWTRRFQRSREIVGHTIILNGVATEVVGILPPSFDFSSTFSPGSRIEIIVPFPITDATDKWGNTLAVIGRLKPGVGLKSAQSEFDVINQQLKAEHPERKGYFDARMSALQEQIGKQFRRPFLILFGAVGCVLLIACTNLSNLLLARATSRRKEMAIRLALGASRSRIINQLLTESTLLSFFGAALGLPLAVIATKLLSQSHAFNIPLLSTARVDGAALLFTLIIAFSTGLLFGIVPAFRLSNSNLDEDLKEGSRGSSQGRGRLKIREVLVVIEVATACVLLVGAGLFIRSFSQILNINPGFRSEQAAAWPINPRRTFANETEKTVYYDDLVHRIKSLPGVESVGLSDTLPLGRNRAWDATPKGAQYQPGDEAFPRIVDPGYLAAMKIPIRSGRDFESADSVSGDNVIIINEALALKSWRGQEAVGQILRVNGGEFRVIGVAGNVRHSALEEQGGPEVYLLGAQVGWASEELVVRTSGSLKSLIPAVTSTLRQFEPNMAVTEFRTLGQIVDLAVSPKRLMTALLGFFSVLALVLASIGIYGVISYSVSQRKPEIGIRLALGASTRDISSLVIGEGMKPVMLGLLLGWAGAFLLTRIIKSLLYGVSATDPLTFIFYGLVLFGVAFAACFLPARRASRMDPLGALRVD
ncbi:MAG: permease [Verrucomicrobiales bacterium]|nr:permease [Verrucomicrobiales bacterium]